MATQAEILASAHDFFDKLQAPKPLTIEAVQTPFRGASHTHTYVFESLSVLLAHIETNRTAAGRWAPVGGQDASVSFDWGDNTPSLAATVQMARTGVGHEASVQRIAQLAADLTATMPPPASVKRVPTWGRSGHRVSVNRVLSGQLQQAWRTTTKAVRPAQGKILTVLLPATWAWHRSRTQIQWSTAASLAYAMLCEQAGYRVELWAVNGFETLYTSGADGLQLVRLKAPAAPWDLQAVAVVADSSFLRRLLWRVNEMSQAQWGDLAGNYGFAMRLAALTTALTPVLVGLGVTAESVRYGAMEADDITDHPSATRWLTTQLAGMGGQDGPH